MVGAICALYSDDTATCLRLAKEIPEGTPPAGLKPLFFQWAGKGGEGDRNADADGEHQKPSPAVSRLFYTIIAEQHPLSLLAEQAEEALNQGMLEHFETLVFKILRELHEQPRADGPLLALRFAAKCLKDLEAAGQSDGNFFSTIIRALGRSDGFLALGLSLLGRDNEAALAALNAALQADDQLFLTPSIRRIVEETISVLRGSEKKGKRVARKKTAQLELF
ncbi:hypothetical protein MASR2M78_26730 [Treponema sp.]